MAEIVSISTVAAEGSHWYARDGRAVYTVIGKNGKERPATLRDARELQLVPGHTGILAVSHKEALVMWKVRQAVLSALTMPRPPGPITDAMVEQIIADSKEEAKQAAAKGNELHTAVELAYQARPFDPKWRDHVAAIHNEMFNKFGTVPWQAEHSYANPIGYGCKLDLHYNPREIIVDHKGKDGELDDKACTIYDEHRMQLAAQRMAANMPQARCFINFFRRDEPGSRCVEVPDDELRRGWLMFCDLLSFWKHKNKYESGWQE